MRHLSSRNCWKEPTTTGLSARSERYEYLGEIRCFVAEPAALAGLTPVAA
jgi:hypothetical protein